mmetsp:Transcript_51742/g.78582  ORF Transcript_51742/g.78582 Transcript_51742/m.78582 type:complete len:150 (+) Transcript_51742:44-493(+)
MIVLKMGYAIRVNVFVISLILVKYVTKKCVLSNVKTVENAPMVTVYALKVIKDKIVPNTHVKITVISMVSVLMENVYVYQDGKEATANKKNVFKIVIVKDSAMKMVNANAKKVTKVKLVNKHTVKMIVLEMEFVIIKMQLVFVKKDLKE